MADLNYIEPSELAEKIEEKSCLDCCDEKQKIHIIDVRDEGKYYRLNLEYINNSLLICYWFQDFIGGHIVSAKNHPSEKWSDNEFVDELVQTYQNSEMVTSMHICRLLKTN